MTYFEDMFICLLYNEPVFLSGSVNLHTEKDSASIKCMENARSITFGQLNIHS